MKKLDSYRALFSVLFKKHAENEQKMEGLEAWELTAKKENISQDIINRVKEAKLRFPLFFARALSSGHMGTGDEFVVESRHYESEFEVFQTSFHPKTLDDLTFDEFLNKLNQIRAELDRNRSSEKWFNPDGKMKLFRVVKGKRCVYEIFIYDDYESQWMLFRDPKALCISRMFGQDSKRYMEHTYGGHFVLICENGKQQYVYSTNSTQAGGFQTVLNGNLDSCQKALCLALTYDIAHVRQPEFRQHAKDCADPVIVEEINYIIETCSSIPMEVKRQWLTTYELKRNSPQRRITLLLSGEPHKLPQEDQKVIKSTRELIQQGLFDWAQALEPLYKENPELKKRPYVPREQRENPEERVLPPNVDVNADMSMWEINEDKRISKVADFSIKGVKLAFDMEMQAFKDRVAKYKITHGRAPSSEEEKVMRNPLNDITNYAIGSTRGYGSPSIVARLMEHVLRVCSLKAMDDLISTFEKAGVESIANELKSLRPWKIASLPNREDKAESDLVNTRNHHAIRLYYQNAVRGKNQLYQQPNTGKAWPKMEAFIVDELLSEEVSLGQIKVTLIDYLSKVKNPEERLGIIISLIRSNGGEKTPAFLKTLSTLVPLKFRKLFMS